MSYRVSEASLFQLLVPIDFIPFVPEEEEEGPSIYGDTARGDPHGRACQ